MYIANMSNSEGVLNYQNFVFLCSLVDNNPDKLIETYNYINNHIRNRQLKRYLKRTKINETLYMMLICNNNVPTQTNYILENINKENLPFICFSILHIDRYVYKRKLYNKIFNIVFTKEEKNLLYPYVNECKLQLIDIILHRIYRINYYIDDVVTYFRRFMMSTLYYTHRTIRYRTDFLYQFASNLIDNEDYVITLCENNLLTKELIDKIYFTDNFHVLVKYARQYRSYIDSLMMVNKLGGVE